MIALETTTTHRTIEDCLYLVDRAVAKVARRIPAFIDREDLRSVGLHALVKLLRANEGATEAQIWVRVYGAILDDLRDSDVQSRSDRADAKKVEAAVQTLTSRLGRPPIIPEIAAETGLSGFRVGCVLAMSEEIEQIDLNSISDDSPRPTEVADKLDVGEALLRILETLPARQAEVLKKYYFEGKTLAEIAALLGTSLERIRQLRVAGETKVRVHASARALWELSGQ